VGEGEFGVEGPDFQVGIDEQALSGGEGSQEGTTREVHGGLHYRFGVRKTKGLLLKAGVNLQFGEKPY
jgi:hypothetical protein